MLKNLRLKPDALAELDLPLTVKAGLLGTLTLKVPWSSLGRVPVDVTIDRLYILAAPKEEESGCAKEDTEEAVAAAFQEAKLKRVARQESKWIDEMQQLEQKKGQAAKTKGGGGGGGAEDDGGGGFLRGLIDTILGNLQFSISNVHIRYEDAETHPGQPFACGATLERVSGSTVDEVGRAAFVTTSPLDLLRKALLLRRVAVYYDCNVPARSPESSWDKLPAELWEDWFQPGIALSSPLLLDTTPIHGRKENSGASTRQYMLHPVDGRATYTRRGRNVRRTDSEPASEFEVSLEAVALALSQPQYHSYSLLLSEVSTFTARLPQLGYRPRCRPAPGAAARVWWQYAGLAVKQQRESRRLTWTQVQKFAQMRRQYVPMYVQYLQGERKVEDVQAGTTESSSSSSSSSTAAVNDDGTPVATSTTSTTASTSSNKMMKLLPKEIVEMDAVLPEHTILMFRRLAYAEVQRERRRAAKAAAAAGKTPQQASEQGSTSWLGWLMGSKPAADTTTTTTSTTTELPPATAEERGQQRAELSADEYNKLIELVTQQEEGLQLGLETPFSLLTKINLRVGSASALLQGPDGSTVLRGSLEGISAAADMFPVTRRVELSVTAMGVESPEGMFLQTGAERGQFAGGGSREFDSPVMDRASKLLKIIIQVALDDNQ